MPKPLKRTPKTSAGKAARNASQMELSVMGGGEAGGTDETGRAASAKAKTGAKSETKTSVKTNGKTGAKKAGGKKIVAEKIVAEKIVAKAAAKGAAKKSGKSAPKTVEPKAGGKSRPVKKAVARKTVHRAVRSGGATARSATLDRATAGVLDRLFEVVTLRRDADPNISHSARLLSRGTAKVAQKFGEEAVECLIEAVAGNSAKLIGESADVLYHLIVMWVDAGVHPAEIWSELQRREGTSGIAEKLGRVVRQAEQPVAGE